MELESALVDQKDYCALKKELDILKSTQFAGEDEQKIESQSLETLLLSQNRGLQTENSQLRKQNISITNDLKQSGTNVQALQGQVQNQEALIEKLEKDLLMVNALPSAYRYSKRFEALKYSFLERQETVSPLRQTLKLISSPTLSKK